MGTYSAKEIGEIGVLIEKRKELYENTKEIRSMYEASRKMYSDDSAYILELIQNADDCSATSIRISVSESEFRLEHNGRPFNLNDIFQITKASSLDNEKANNTDKIGQFGIGFKSVFNVTNSPRIVSGKYEFEIQNFIIPKFLRPNLKHETVDFTYKEKNDTTIILPFIDLNKHKSSVERLEKISEQHIMFLNNLEQLIIDYGNRIDIIEKKKIDLSEILITEERKSLYESLIKNEIAECFTINKRDFLVFSGSIVEPVINSEHCRNTKIALEVKREEDSLKFIPIRDANFNVYFPTNTPTGLQFYIQGKYAVSMNREELSNTNQSFADNSSNSKIIDMTSMILVRAVDVLHTLGLFNVSLIETIISKNENQTIVSEKMNNALLLHFEKNMNYFSRVKDDKDIIIATEDVITKIFDSEHFYEDSQWIDIDYIKFSGFLAKIKDVKVINLERIIDEVENDKSLIEKCNTKKLYNYLIKNSNETSKLKFIKTDSGTYENLENMQLFLTNEVEDLDEIKMKIKNSLDLDFNPLFIDENVCELVKGINHFESLNHYKIANFIDEKYFRDQNDSIVNINSYFAGFNIVMQLMRGSRKRFKLNHMMLLTKNGDEGYLKASKDDVYFLSNYDIRKLYIESGALSEKRIIDSDVYDKHVQKEFKELYISYVLNSGVKVSFIKDEVEETLRYEFYNKSSHALFNNRQLQEKDQYYCNIYSPSIVKGEKILKYLTHSGTLHESRVFFKMVYQFFSKVHYKKPYFEYYYNKFNRVELDEFDFITMLKDYKWLYINEKKFQSKHLEWSTLNEVGYFDEISDYTMLEKLCNSLDINIGDFSSGTAEVLDIINEMSVHNLSVIREKIDTLINEYTS